MKKLLFVAAFAAGVSLAASFGSGGIEVGLVPAYDQRRDQQWMQSQQNQQREQQQQREQWQRAQWQKDQQQLKRRNEPQAGL
jgi:hypothetical protein